MSVCNRFKGMVAMLLFTAMACVWAADDAQQERLSVDFENHESFSDFASARFGPGGGQQQLQRKMRRALSRLVAKYLENNQLLELRFTNIDMAGRLVPGQSLDHMPGQNIPFDNPDPWYRVVERNHPPSLAFEYRLLTNSGEVLDEQQVELTDHAFVSNVSSRMRQQMRDELAFEIRLLENWFRATFGRKYS